LISASKRIYPKNLSELCWSINNNTTLAALLEYTLGLLGWAIMRHD